VAHRLGEPYGTLVLTLSAISIEVAIVAAVMLTGHGDATIARDTMFATLMIIMNGLVGVALLVGGWRRHEQFFNLQSAASYLPLIITLATVALVLPRFTHSAPGGRMGPGHQVFAAFACIVVYGGFLWLQTSRYRSFFEDQGEGTRATSDDADREREQDAPRAAEPPAHVGAGGLGSECAWLLASLLAVVLLAEGLGERSSGLIERVGAPVALSGLLVAVLILTPEGLAAVRAAQQNSMQRTMNILLGSALSTIGLTVPAVLLVAIFLHRDVELGLEPTELVLLAGTLLVSMTTVMRGRVNPMQGVVHATLFLAYVVLIFD
jgi:Ca2+:H+ antiporter